MWTRQRKKRNLGRLIVPVISAAFLSYFGFHAYNGEYGIYAKYRLEERTATLKVKLDAVTAERKAMEARVQLLHDGTLERDMLDEQARRALDFTAPDEITILRNRSN